MTSKCLAPLLISCVACAGARVAVETSAPIGSAELEVIAAVDAMFAAMRDHDVPALQALVAEGAIIVRLGEDEGGEANHTVIPAEAFIGGTAGDGPVIDERFTAQPEVRIDGAMASLWGVYDVRVDGQFKHCGVDAVHLARLGETWKVIAITYTTHLEGCEASPPS